VDCETKEVFALKVYERKKLIHEREYQNVQNEISNLRSLDHPNVIKLVTDFVTHSQIIIVMQCATSCSLQDHLDKKQVKKLPVGRS